MRLLLELAGCGRRRPSSDFWRRLGVTAAGAALGTFAILAALATPQLLDREAARVDVRTPILASSPLQPDQTLGAGWAAEVIQQAFRGRELTRVLIAGGDRPGTSIPGLPRLPRPGELFASPSLTDERAPEYLGRAVDGVIAPAGLRSPDELLLYQGVELDELTDPRRVRSVGSPSRGSTGRAHYAGHTLALFVGFPSLALFALSARGFARAREDQLRALRLLGAPPGLMRGLVATDVALAAALGGVAAGAAFELARRQLTSIPLVDHSFYSSDARLSVGWFAVALLSAPIVAAVVAVSTTGRAAKPSITLRANLNPVAPRRRSVLPLAAATLLLALMATVGRYQLGGAVELGLWSLASTGVVVGLPLAMGALLKATSGPAARLGTVAAQLGFRRMSYRAGGEARLAGALGASLFVVGCGTLYAGFLPPPNPPDRVASGGLAVSVVGYGGSDLPRSFDVAVIRGKAQPLLPVFRIHDRRGRDTGASAVVVDCTDLKELLGEHTSCPHSPSIVSSEVSQTGAIRVPSEFLLGTARLSLSSTPTIAHSAWAAQMDGMVALPPTAFASLKRAGEPKSYLAVVPSVAAIDALRRDLIVDAPSVLVTYPTDFDIIADGYQRATGWLVICMVCSATLLGVAFIAASLDVGAASRAFALAVRVTSPPRSVLTRAHLYATAVPPIIGTLLGVSLSVLGGRVIASSRGFALPWAVFGWLLIAGLICACIAAVITAPFGTPSGPGRRRE